MIVLDLLTNIPSLKKPIALTIGTFDSVHLGHQFLFHELKKRGTPVVFTFSNHPLEILKPQEAPIPILSLSEKLKLFSHYGIEMVIVAAFTKEFSQIRYDYFLRDLHTALHFSTLIGGKDLRLGARGEGNGRKIRTLAKTLGFELVLLPKFKIGKEIVSSRQIRKFIANQQTEKALKWVGRPKGSL